MEDEDKIPCINDDIAMLDLRMMPYPETSITWKAYEDAKKKF